MWAIGAVILLGLSGARQKETEVDRQEKAMSIFQDHSTDPVLAKKKSVGGYRASGGRDAAFIARLNTLALMMERA